MPVLAHLVHQLFIGQSSGDLVILFFRIDRLQPLLNLLHLVCLGQFLDLFTQTFGSKTKMTLKHLANVHAGRNTQRIQDHVNGGAVSKIRHIFFRQQPGDNTLVAVTTGHFVTHRQFALGGNINLDHLDYARGQIITLFHPLDNTLIALTNYLGLSAVANKNFLQLILILGALGKFQAAQPLECNLVNNFGRQFFTQLEQNSPVFILDIRLDRTADQQVGQSFAYAFFQAAEFIVHITIEATDLVILDHQAALVLVHTLAGKNLGVNDHAFNTRRYAQRRIFNIAGLFTENCPQQFLLRREHGLALRRYLAHQHVTGSNFSTDTNNTGIIQVAQGLIADIRNVTGDLFLAQLGIPGHSLENLDMDRGKGIFLEQPFIDKNGILKVIAAPGHEGDGHVLAQGQFTDLDRGSVCQYISFLHPFSGQNQRFLIKTGILVGLFILGQPIHTDTGIKTICSGLVITNNDPVGVNLFHNSCTTCQQTGS